VLIEAGRVDYHGSHIPVASPHRQPAQPTGCSTPSPTRLNGCALRYLRGKTLGGCSSINADLQKSTRRDYDKWAELTGDSLDLGQRPAPLQAA
jgi:choline dehydrogenase